MIREAIPAKLLRRCIALLLFPVLASSAPSPSAVTKVVSSKVLDQRLELVCTTDSGQYAPVVGISFPNADTVRVQAAPRGTLAQYGASSVVDFQKSESTAEVILQTSRLEVRINKSPWRLRILRGSETLLDDNPAGATTSRLRFNDGEKGLTLMENAFGTPTEEHFFGFGEKFNSLDKRGKWVRTWVNATWREDLTSVPVPFFLSSRGYGFFLNSTSEASFDMGASEPDRWLLAVRSGENNPLLDYYFFGFQDPKQSLAEFTALTGRIEKVPPRWVFGPWMSNNGVNTQRAVLCWAATTRALDIPATAMVLETWQSGMSRTWDQILYPNPRRMIELLHKQYDMRLILWDLPGMLLPHDLLYQEAARKGYLPKNPDGGDYIAAAGWSQTGSVVDFSNPAAVDWWMNTIHGPLAEMGVDGYKLDDGEDIYVPQDRQVPVFHNSQRGTEMHNLYPVLYAKAYHDFLWRHGGGVLFSRSGFTGIGAFPGIWAGDHGNTFEEYRGALLAGLSAGLSGIPFWSWDLAGLTGHASDELYVRSAQMATFCPIMQYHHISLATENFPNDPWFFALPTQEIYTKYARLRMNLIPYILTTAYQALRTGVPLMRAMYLEYPHSPRTYLGRDFQYFFGDALLVAPVVEEGARAARVYLPPGSWIDFWTNRRYEGRQEIFYNAPLDVLPLFVRNGSLLPMELNRQFQIGGSMKAGAQAVVLVYPQGNTASEWFDDQEDATIQLRCEDKRATKRQIVLSAKGKRLRPWTYRILASRPVEVRSAESLLPKVSRLEELTPGKAGWFYQEKDGLVYVAVDGALAAKITVQF